MCLIVVKPEGVTLPKKEYLRYGSNKNSDGMGIAYLKKSEKFVKIKKDFSCFYQLQKFLDENITKEDILIVHFRWATSGLKDKGNSHPFPLTKNKDKLRALELDCKFAIAHNGVLTQLEKNDTFSDTQEFILQILHDPIIKENLDRPSVKLLVDNFLNGDRLTVLNNKRELWLMGDFTEEKDDGCFYSNSNYKGFYSNSKYKSFYSDSKYNEWKNQNGVGFTNHWNYSSFQNLEPKSKDPKLLTNSSVEDNPLICICEGCKVKKKTRMFRFKDEDDIFYLCKKCRRRARQGKLTIGELDNGIISSILCDSCNNFYNEKETVEIYGEFKVCPDCAKEIKEVDIKREKEKQEVKK